MRLDEETVMTEFALGDETVIRLVFFFGILAVMAAWEVAAPRRGLLRSAVRALLHGP